MQLKLNLTATEYECLVRRANAVAMRPARYGRMLVLDKKTVPAAQPGVPSNLERLNYLALSRVGNNLNQMMRHLHQTGEPVPADLEPLLADVREIINRAIKKWGLLPTEWVNLDVFLQVEADFKGFLVNLMVMSSQARCAHAKIRQEETSAG
jgi:hypothetical protein